MKGDIGSLAAENAAEVPTDPGLIILYDPEAVHIALGQPNSPVAQGANMKESFENFKQYVYGKILLKTPCTESEHAIRKCDGGPGVQETYFTELFHRLPADTFRAILEVLHQIFIILLRIGPAMFQPQPTYETVCPPTDRWGLKVEGGLGVGRVTFAVSCC